MTNPPTPKPITSAKMIAASAEEKQIPEQIAHSVLCFILGQWDPVAK